MIMIKKSPISKLLLSERGPDDFISNCLTKDVMQYVVLDEAGPFFLTSQSQKLEQVYIQSTPCTNARHQWQRLDKSFGTVTVPPGKALHYYIG